MRVKNRTKEELMGLLSKSTKTKTKPKRESQFLKLVHAGGFVELHGSPIMASEVMKRNPRHYVTRHDFFQFPLIVVRPESILTPGNVFLIVPCHTVRQLSKSTNTNSNHTSNTTTPLSAFNHFLPNQSSLVTDYYPYIDRQISNSNKILCFPKQPSLSTSMSCVKPRHGPKHTKVGGNMSPSFSFREKPVFYSSDYTSHDSGRVKGRIRSNRITHSEQIPKLKPCLKKDTDKSHNASSRRNLKVRFEFNDHDVNTQLHNKYLP